MSIGKKIVAVVVIGSALLSIRWSYAADEKQKDLDTSSKAPTTAPASDDAMKLLDEVTPLIGGQWKIKANWTGGEPLDARAVYEWGIGKKFIEARTYVNAPEGEYQRYLTMFGVQDGKLHAWQFTFDGHADQLDFSIDGKKLSSARTMKSANGGGDS